MKDFDEERAQLPVKTEEERTFKLGGETFTVRARVRADILAAASRVTANSEAHDDLDAFDETILGFLEEEDHERYLELRRRDKDPITFWNLYDLAVWGIGVAAGRPTLPPSPSGVGPETTRTTLTDVSSQPPAAQAG